MKLYIEPNFRGEDKGDGGIRRVVEAQKRYLPALGVDIVDSEEQADIVSVHAGSWIDTRKPVVSHCHGLYWAEYTWSRWHHDLNRHVINALRKADAVTAPSKWVARILQRGMLLEPTVLYHGIEPEEWQPGTDKGYVLWNKTRVDPVCDSKPVHELAALAPDVLFKTTFGDSAKNIEVTGKLPYLEGKELIANASIYLCTARETMGIGTLEAMVCGVPVLGWSWGGQAEIIRHKETGWLARPGDYEGLLAGLRWLLENRGAVSSTARQFVLDHMTWTLVMPQYKAVYDALLPPQGQSGAALRIQQQQQQMQSSIGARTVSALPSPPCKPGYARPKVSVVIPCYNMADLLPRAVQSAQEQPFKDWEIVIVDDASTDATAIVASQLATDDARIRVIHNVENLYLAGSLNAGIGASVGEYIVPLDADNCLGHDALGILAGQLDASRDIDIAYGSMEVIEPDGKHFVSGWPVQFDYVSQMAHRNQCPSTSMYRRRVWSRTGGYRRRCRTAEDADFWCRVTSYGFQPRKVTEAVTFIYYNRSNSMSHVEKDWDWTAWHPKYNLTPFGAVSKTNPVVPTYEPVTISVIIPVGPGHGRYLIDALDSLTVQTFLKWEVIVVNDSGEPLPWVPPFVEVVEAPGGVGPAKARNLGIEKSGAPLFLLLDADDYLQPTALESLYTAWVQHGGYAYCDWVVQETGEYKQTPEYHCSDVLGRLPHAVTALYPKKAWTEIGGFDESLPAWEDWDFVIALNAAGYCGLRVPEPLFQYRLGTGTQRESAYAKKEELRAYIFEKWKKFITGAEELMACRGCSKTAPRSAPKAVPATKAGNGREDAVLIEFLGTSGKVTYTGPETGTRYVFGPDPSHKIRYVFRKDAEVFLRRKEFRVYVPERLAGPLLEAVGPPVR